MSERPVHIRIAALAMVVSAALGVWLEFGEPASDAVVVTGIVAMAILAFVTPVALLPFARRRLPGWSVIGIAIWLGGAAIAGFLATWVVLFVSESTSWSPGDHWFIADPVLQVAGQMLVLIALIQAQPAAQPPRPIRLHVIAIGCGALGVTVILSQVGLMRASYTAMPVLRHLGELSRAGELLLFVWGLVEAERVLRGPDVPLARAYIAGGGGPT